MFFKNRPSSLHRTVFKLNLPRFRTIFLISALITSCSIGALQLVKKSLCWSYFYYFVRVGGGAVFDRCPVDVVAC